MQITDNRMNEIISNNWDNYMDEASWLNEGPSHGILTKAGPVKTKMLIPMWNEYLAFQEGIAKEVYGISPYKMLDKMGSVALLEGFNGYMQGALDIAKEAQEEE